VLVWAVAGITLGREIQQLAEVTNSARDAGRATQSAADALDSLSDAPVVGGAIGDSADRIRSTGQGAIDGAEEGRTRIRRLGVIVGALIAIVPTLPLLVLYLPDRQAELRDRRRILKALRKGDPGIEALLATRAVAHVPYRVLLRVSPDPAGDLQAGRHGPLADAELRRLGLRTFAARR
jgi:hypothetical protein